MPGKPKCSGENPKATAGKRAELSDRFRDHTAAMFEQAGIENVAYWTAATGPDVDDTFVYMLGYPSLEARDEMWRTLGQNEEFQRIIVAGGRGVIKVRTKLRRRMR